MALIQIKTILPSPEEIRNGLGSQWETWQELNQFVIETFKAASELKFYGKNYGWAVRYRKGGKAFISLYPGMDGFAVQIILGENEIAEARQGELSQGTLRAIEAANPYPEGRWLFIEIQSGQDMQDINICWRLKLLSGSTKAQKANLSKEKLDPNGTHFGYNFPVFERFQNHRSRSQSDGQALKGASEPVGIIRDSLLYSAGGHIYLVNQYKGRLPGRFSSFS